MGKSQLGTLQAPIPFRDIGRVLRGDVLGVPEMFLVSPGRDGDCPLAGHELVTVPARPEPPRSHPGLGAPRGLSNIGWVRQPVRPVSLKNASKLIILIEELLNPSSRLAP